MEATLKKYFSKRQIIETASRLWHFPLGWIAYIFIVAVDLVWIAYTKIPLPMSVKFLIVPIFSAYIKILVYLLLNFSSRVPPVLVDWWEKRISLGIEYTLLCTGAAKSLTCLAYLLCALNMPLIDEALHRADMFLGFDWVKVFNVMKDHKVLKIIYDTIISQLVLLMLVFSALDGKKRLHETFWILFLSLLSCVLLSGLFPAFGPSTLTGMKDSLIAIQPAFKHVIADAAAIRAGEIPNFKGHDLGGIITFPSFHTVCAVVYIYAFRGTGAFGWLMALVNAVMLIAIPAFGNHYLVDVIAGAVIAVISMMAVRTVFARVLPPRDTKNGAGA